MTKGSTHTSAQQYRRGIISISQTISNISRDDIFLRDFTETYHVCTLLGYQLILYGHWIYEGQMDQTYPTLIFYTHWPLQNNFLCQLGIDNYQVSLCEYVKLSICLCGFQTSIIMWGRLKTAHSAEWPLSLTAVVAFGCWRLFLFFATWARHSSTNLWSFCPT